MKSPSSRILKERNAERLTATPRRLKSLFGSSHSKKDEVEMSSVMLKVHYNIVVE